MGYSNNKWRKILTILMIINLCFILFAKITKVFGATSSSLTTVTLNDNDYDLDLNYLTSQYKYYFLCWRTLSGRAYLDLFCSDEEMTFYSVGNNKGVIAKSGFELIQFHAMNDISPNNSFNYVVPSWNNTVFNPSLNTHTYYNGSGVNISQTVSAGVYSDYWTITLANYDVKDQNNNIIFNNNVIVYPFFDNLTEIQNGYPNGVFISRGSYSEDDALYFHLLKITNTVPDGNQSTYYYDSKVFKLTKYSKYYKTYDADTDNNYSYYYVKRSALTLDTNSSYLYVLSNSGDSISNSYGILQPDNSLGVYDVVQSDTAGVITEQQALNDKMSNINNNQQEIANNQQEIANNSSNINNYLNENTISNDTNQNIDTNLNFNNNAANFSNLYGSFFSRLSSTISNLGSYNLSNIETIELPIPFTQNTISLTSNIVSQHIPNLLISLFNAFWLFIFSKYFLAYILYIYRLIASGRILDNISSSNEIITNDVL